MRKLITLLIFALVLCVSQVAAAASSVDDDDLVLQSQPEAELAKDKVETAETEPEPEKEAEPKKKNRGWYGGAKIGLSPSSIYETPDIFSSKDFLTYNLGLSMGYDLWVKTPLPLRMEIDFTYRGGDSISANSGGFNSKISISSFCTLMLQAWVDLPLGKVRPYAGGGVGLALVDFKAERGEDDYSEHGGGSTAWMLGGGIAFKVMDGFVDFGYRRVKMIDFKADFGSGLPEYRFRADAHDIFIGVRIPF